jgi:hypothetical protein
MLRKSKWKGSGISQKQMLQEAAVTEVFNQYSLKKHLEFEDEKRGKFHPRFRATDPGPFERYKDTADGETRKVRLITPLVPIYTPPTTLEPRI